MVSILNIKLNQKRDARNKIILNLLLVIPLVIYCLPMILTGNKIIPGDADYQFQLSEAFRKSVLYYHQLPMWNPWIGGGIPLFANAQFGLVSVQSPFILIFGTVIGWKISVLIYQIIAFFGFRKLFVDYFKASTVRATLLAYIVSLGGFFTYRVIAGHFTFLLIAFVPWLLLFFLNRNRKHSWLWFSLILSLMIWSSPHYVTIMSLLVIGVWYIVQTISDCADSIRLKSTALFLRGLKHDGLFFIKSLALTGALTFYRLFFASQFLSEFPRPTTAKEPFTGLRTGLHAIWGVNQYKSPGHLTSGLGWVEASAYIGLGSLIALGLIGLAWAIKIRQSGYKRLSISSLFSYSPIILSILFFIFFILGMGNVGPLSPYTLLHDLPVFGSMRVATRYLMWSSLFALIIIAAYKGARYAKLINVFLALSVIELFVTGLPSISNAYFTKVQIYRQPTAQFDQVYRFQLPRPLYAPDLNFQKIYAYDENLYETTVNNYGQVIAGDALVDTRQPNMTVRCGVNQKGFCPFSSKNAKLVQWSPNKIILQRLGGGDIRLNMNPGRDWKVNGKYVFENYRVTEPKLWFLIQDPAKTIVLQYSPRVSL